MSVSFSSIVCHLLHRPSSHSPIINFSSFIHHEMMIFLFMSGCVNIYSVVDWNHRWIDVGDRKKDQSFHSYCQRSVDTLIGFFEEWTKTDIVWLVHPLRRWEGLVCHWNHSRPIGDVTDEVTHLIHSTRSRTSAICSPCATLNMWFLFIFIYCYFICFIL